MNSKAVPMRMLVVLGIVSLAFVAGCGGGTSQSFNQPPPPSGSNPTPTITSISPSSYTAGGAPFTLTINGTNFVAASTVNFGGTIAIANISHSSTQLTAAIPAAAIATASTAAVTVTNPAPGGGTSNAVNFTITSGPNPIPTISLLDPSCAPVGGPAFALKVWGTNFVASSVVRWNGSDRPTTVNLNAIINGIKGAVATAQIPASDIAAGGTAAVTVFNPATGGGSSNPATFTIAAGGVDPQAVAVDPTGKFAYVANGGCPNAFAGNVSMYTIDATTGALTSIGSPVPAELFPQSVTVDPTGKFAYVTNLFSNSVSMYSINATTGALTSMGLVPAGARPASVAVHPTGKFAYVANNGYGLGGVSMYTINAATGALTSIGMIDAGTSPVSLAVDPTGKFAYVANFGDASVDDFGSVSMYTINATTGALTSTGTIYGSCPGLCGPQSVAVDPTGRFAYVANLGGPPPTVSMFTIDGTTGALTSIGTVTAAAEGLSVAVDPKGKFVYVSEVGGKVSGYSINATTGVLTPVGTIAAAGLCLNSIAIHTSGKFAYLGDSCSNKVLIYGIDATTGTLTLIGTIGT